MIKMKCFDGTQILMNKFNDVYSYKSPLTNYDTLINELDLLGKYKINDVIRYGSSGPTDFEPATGVDAVSMYETYTQDNPYTIQLTKNYALKIYAWKGESGSRFEYYIRVEIYNTSTSNILKGDSFLCQTSDQANLLSFLVNAVN